MGVGLELFGVTFGNAKNKKEYNNQVLKTIELQSIADPDAINTQSLCNFEHGVMEYNNANFYANTEIDLVRQYRTLAQTVEIGQMTSEIFNEVFILDVPNERAFDINFLDNDTLPKSLKEKIEKEVDNLYNISNFRKNGLNWFKDWYIDSMFNVQIVVDEKNEKKGIQRIVPIDPTRLKKVRILPEEEVGGGYDMNKIKEYFIYNNYIDYSNTNNYLSNSIQNKNTNGLRITSESIIQIVSGLRDAETGRTIGHLHKTIVPFNNLKMMEESMLIYRVVRAPMRRIFYIDVSRMTPARAESYLAEQMKRFKVKFVYNSKTGKATSQTHLNSMIEDIYLPRHDGKNTEIQTLDGQSSQEILEEIEYLKDKLYRAGNVPLSRLQESNGSFVFGRSTEIQRDEYKFKKFLNIIRANFMSLFDELLKRQLILKGIIKEHEWLEISGSYEWVYSEDNAFVEWKEAEILQARLDQLDRCQPYVGKYFSSRYVRKHILYHTDEEMDRIDEEIKNEIKDGIIEDPDDEDNNNQW